MKSNDSPSASNPLRLDRLVSTANRWREQYNPLRNLTLERALSLLEAYQRGEMADVQWTYYFVEQADPDLFALVERRASAILELDWHIKTREFQVSGFKFQEGGENAISTAGRDSKLAAEQAAALREAYEGIDNLYEAIEHLAMATFRGFAHLEKCTDGLGRVEHLEVLDPWNVVRDGMRGAWKYNPEAKAVAFRALGPERLLDAERWIIREVKRPINRIGLLKYVRGNVAEKDWAAFVEVYGLPGAIITGPPNVAPEEASHYEEQAALVAEGGSGYLPNGASVSFYTGPRLMQPFRDYLRYLSEQLVLAGTGGILTMLTTSGTGTLAGSVHAETFRQIARAEARVISEVLQDQFDRAVLDQWFPGQPRLAYFELAANEELNLGAFVDNAVKLAQAGYRIKARELAEKTGFNIADLQLPMAN